LHDEPVLAGPPGAGYRLWKFVKRHRGPVLAATLVLLALVAGIGGTTWGLVGAPGSGGKATAAPAPAGKELLRAGWLLHASQINQAQQAWESNDARLAHHYHALCRADFRGWEHDYLFTLFSRNQRTYGKQRPVNEPYTQVSSVAVSPDGRLIVSGNLDTTVKVWDADTGQETLTFKGHHGSVASVAFSADGQRIVSGGWDNAVRVWDANTVKKPLTLTGHRDVVTSVVFSPDGKHIASGSWDGTVKVWDAVTGGEPRTLTGHTGQVFGVA